MGGKGVLYFARQGKVYKQSIAIGGEGERGLISTIITFIDDKVTWDHQKKGDIYKRTEYKNK